MSSVGKTISRAVTAVGTMGLSEAAGVGQMIQGKPKQPGVSPVVDAAIKPVTPEQKAELAEQEYNKQRKSKRFTTLLTSRGDRDAATSTLQPQLSGSLSKLAKFLG